MNELNLQSVEHSIKFIENVVKIVRNSKTKIYDQNRAPKCILGVCLYDSQEFWSVLHFEAYYEILNRDLTTDEYYAAVLGKRCDSYNDAEWVAVNLFGLGVTPNYVKSYSDDTCKNFKISKNEWLEKATQALTFLNKIID